MRLIHEYPEGLQRGDVLTVAECLVDGETVLIRYEVYETPRGVAADELDLLLRAADYLHQQATGVPITEGSALYLAIQGYERTAEAYARAKRRPRG